jgi:hypothetical protein
MNSLIECYQPRWLYLTEFSDALPGADESEKREAIALLVRDRIIVDGHLNEAEFRFLEGNGHQTSGDIATDGATVIGSWKYTAQASS